MLMGITRDNAIPYGPSKNELEIYGLIFFLPDIAQGNFSEEIAPPEVPAQKDGSIAKNQDPLRPELPSEFCAI